MGPRARVRACDLRTLILDPECGSGVALGAVPILSLTPRGYQIHTRQKGQGRLLLP